VVVLGANKSGKTWVSQAQHIGCAHGYRFWDVPDLKLVNGWLPPREEVSPQYWIRTSAGVPLQVPNTGMIVTGLSRERGIGQIIFPVLEGFTTPQLRTEWHVVKGALGVPTQIRWPNGSLTILASAEQEALSFEGTRLDWALFDEPCPPFIFNGIWRGLAVDRGPCMFTLTPLGANAAWMYLKWVRNTPQNATVLKMLQRDNPALSEAEIKRFEENGEWSEAERKARIEGDFESLANRVLYNFESRVHIIPARVLPSDWTTGLTVDPHHARPPAMGWWKRSPDGVYHFIREYPTEQWNKITSGGIPPTALAILIRNVEGREPSRVKIADPRFAKAAFTTVGEKMTPWADQMAALGPDMQFDTRVPNTGTVEFGEQLIVDMLRWDKTFPISPTNTPRIFIHDNCKNMAMACENYGVLLSRDPTKYAEKRSDEWKDWIDIIRYTILYPVDAALAGSHDMWSDEEWKKENAAQESWYA